MDKYKTVRDLVKMKRESVKTELNMIKQRDNKNEYDQRLLEIKDAILKQSDTDLALVYENIIQIRHDQQILKTTSPVNAAATAAIQERIERLRAENEQLYTRLEHWLYPIDTVVNAEEQEEAIRYLQSADYQRAKQSLVVQP